MLLFADEITVIGKMQRLCSSLYAVEIQRKSGESSVGSDVSRDDSKTPLGKKPEVTQRSLVGQRKVNSKHSEIG